MARPERKTVDYFPHYISDGKKMFFIEHKYGNDGYAVWFKILESLATTDNHFLDFSNENELMFMSAKCRIDQSVLISILEDLSKLGEIDSELWELRIVWCEKFIESIIEVYSRRNNKCMTKLSLCKHLHSLGRTVTSLKGEKVDSNTQTKLNNTIQDQKKLMESRKLKFSETLKPFLPFYGKDLLNDFYFYWSEPNPSNTKMRFELQKTWSVELRLKTWAKNDKNFVPNKDIKPYNPRS